MRTIKNLEKFLFWKLIGRSQFGKPVQRYKDTFKVYATEVVRKGVNCFIRLKFSAKSCGNCNEP
jgi:hypothetical protein